MNQSKSSADPPNNNKRQDSPVKSNPFDTYKSQANQQQQEPPNKLPPQSPSISGSSHSTPRSHSSASRSRSRDRQNPSEQRTTPQLQGGHQNDDRDRRHIDQGQANSGAKGEQGQQTYFKTKMCPLFEKGQCQKGNTCSFAHGEKQLRGLPNFRKTRLCIPFKNGECPKASEDCKYAHGQGELRKLVYDYVPPKGHRGIENPRFTRADDRHSRDRPRKFNNDINPRDDRRNRGSHHRDSRDQDPYRSNNSYRDHRDHGHRDHRDRHRDSRDRDRYRERDRDSGRDRERERGDHYNRGYEIRPSQMAPPPYAGYMAGYNGQYMVHPQVMGGYGGEIYGGMGSGNPGFSGSGSGYAPPPSSSSGQHGYGYGYLPPHSYSSYGSV